MVCEVSVASGQVLRVKRVLRVLAEDEGRALGVEVGGDREVGVREVVRRHFGEGPAIGNNP